MKTKDATHTTTSIARRYVAWAGQTGLTLGQVAVDAKSNEIKAMPQLLEVLDLHDKIVTTDAMGCQKAIAETIVAGGGDYILAVKANQRTLHAEIQAAFATAATPPARSPRLYTTEDQGTGVTNSARCRCCLHAATCRRRRARRGWACSRSSWSPASCGVRRRAWRASRGVIFSVVSRRMLGALAPQVRGGRQREPDAGREGHIRRHTSGTFGQQNQRGAWNDPPGDLTATPPVRRGPRSVVAVPCRNLAAVASVHACAPAAWQHEPAF